MEARRSCARMIARMRARRWGNEKRALEGVRGSRVCVRVDGETKNGRLRARML